MKTLVILSHPNLAASRVNKALSQVAKSAADVEVRHLEGLYGLDIARIDARAEQDALAGAERIVFLYPMHWLNVPPMLK
ncbi:NAD(P)H-dependent oxidoreductase, partial [Campylobacter concisus]|uniref:NAD(P)H-dependent oxidoreductase n=1 Tax=Campylobacter concisus TaxID=199 RepID=UPI00112F86F7